ncbi:MAG: tetratricopeptide repeat protein [Kiritimatiellae bacterium]|nr:tetratricopeptide repeat protein [Kiritimatiellia bacterium]
MLVTLAGCGIDSARDQRDERDPLLRRAQSRKNANDIEGAIDAYQRALDKKPQLALAHLQLGILFDQNREDYVRAIYHYERYLEMRPQSEKAELVRELVGQARVDFAASLPDKPSEAIRAIAMLKGRERRAARSVGQIFPRPDSCARAGCRAAVGFRCTTGHARCCAPCCCALGSSSGDFRFNLCGEVG